ncbi:MAG: SDR family NAD(P)-dependent oxidoreductase [Flammeovirgaceae bacterium]|nr:SDR family NAD(P)-dependent oxidoreductase [Flammeovirgaceae bacterium]
MDLHLTDKIAFVAASSSGLGKSVAIELAKEGVQVIICGRNPDTLNKAKAEIEKFGNVFAIAGDLTNNTDRDRIIKHSIRKI